MGRLHRWRARQKGLVVSILLASVDHASPSRSAFEVACGLLSQIGFFFDEYLLGVLSPWLSNLITQVFVAGFQFPFDVWSTNGAAALLMRNERVRSIFRGFDHRELLDVR